VFASTTSDTAIYLDQSGSFADLDSLNVHLIFKSMLVITFSARGTVAPSGSELIPIVFVECEIDGIPCTPDFNSVEFLYPQFCCDTRSFTWIVHSAATGNHTVSIRWGMGNPTSAAVSNRTLLVESALVPRSLTPTKAAH
jgi:hypothetical protein